MKLMKTHQFPVFLFDDVEVEPQTLNILKAGREIEIEPKAFKVLLFLIENRGRLIEKNELLDAIWTDSHVTENALTREIAQLRKLLGDDPKTARYIQTVHTRGYRFIAEVTVKNGRETNDSAELDRVGVEEPGKSDESASPVTTPIVTAQQTETKPRFRHSVSARILALAGALGVLFIAATFAWKIYTKPASLPATAPLRIAQVTSWPGLDVNPTFSPDGHAVAYSSDHGGSFEIYLKPLAPGGREIQLTADGGQNFDPAWSPDGERIAYYSRKRGGIWVMPALGGVAKQLTTFGRSSCLVARWPDDCVSVSLNSRSRRIRDGIINDLHCFFARRLTAVAHAPRLSGRLAFFALLVARWKPHRVPQLQYGLTASLDDLRRGRRIEANHSARHWGQNLSLLLS